MPKKIIIACDGTWLNSDDGFKRTSSWFSSDVEGVLAIPSNVTHLCRALKPAHENGESQLCYYQTGLGSAANWYSYYIGGYLGEGLSENIREAYVFLCNNYEDGDEIYLIGFSRGAFTARSIGGLIDAMGLLTRKGLIDFYCIFRDWEFMDDENYYKPNDKQWVKAINIPEPRPNYGQNKIGYVDELVKLGLTRPKITVEVTAVWDTVGSLGIPQFVVPPLSWIQGSQNQNAQKAYSFINTEVPSNLRHAFQALALDERRTPFQPTIWEEPPPGSQSQLKELKQTWFAGVHSNVGGQYPDFGIALTTLAWMIQKLSPFLTFDTTYIADQAALYAEYLKTQKEDRSWSCGYIYDNSSRVQDFLVGTSTRTPGNYTRTDSTTGNPTKELLRDTHESVHPSVRVRFNLYGVTPFDGLGTADKNRYNDPWPFKGWALVPPKGTFSAKTTLPRYNANDLWGSQWNDCWKWVNQDSDGKITWIAEEPLEGDELELLVRGSKASDILASTA